MIQRVGLFYIVVWCLCNMSNVHNSCRNIFGDPTQLTLSFIIHTPLVKKLRVLIVTQIMMLHRQPHCSSPVLFGRLVPLVVGGGDGDDDKNNNTLPLPSSNSSTQLMTLPGTFGRTELLQPYAKMKCPHCQRIKKENEKKKSAAAAIELCRVCQSIQSMAKFLPRKDFLNFGYQNNDGDGKQRRELLMTVSGRNATDLVQISSMHQNDRKVSTQRNQDGIVTMVVNDGDIISICWYQRGGDITSFRDPKPLIQFRVMKCTEAVGATVVKTNIDELTVQKKIATFDENVEADTTKITKRPQHDNNTNISNEVIFRPSEHATYFRDNNKEGIKSGQESSQEEEEEEEESAPLSLPSKFLASSSKSFSFDSQLHSTTSPPKSIFQSTCDDNCTSSQKRKTPPQTGDATNSSFSTSKTPKKSNINRSNDEPTKETVTLSSLSYDQLLQIRDQSSKPLRKHVLSLALALTSNASAYDSNFIQEIQDFQTPGKAGRKSNDNNNNNHNQVAIVGSGSKSESNKDSESAGANTEKWIPRLLQGTQVRLE